MPEIVTRCPSCRSTLRAVRLHCANCEVAVEGQFDLCPFCRLGDEQRAFALTFLRCRGNIKEVERDMGISYPTVRGKLEDLLRALEAPAAAVQSATAPPGPTNPSTAPEKTLPGEARTRLQILQELQSGRLSRNDAMALLRDISS
jgi:hypothetical protein